MRVFLSYGHDEYAAFALRLKADLEAGGHEVWFDLDRIRPGDDFSLYIEQGLDWCAADPGGGRMLLVMTPHSVRRPHGFCIKEIARGLERNLYLVPVLLAPCEPPIYISHLQRLDLTDCWPPEERRERYERKRALVLEALERKTLDLQGAHSYLVHHLQPLDFSAEIASRARSLVGREWVFAAIDSWLGDPRGAKVLWLNGEPGIGKTSVAAFLCDRHPSVAAIHLCRHGDEDKTDPRRFVLSLAFQLASQIPAYHEKLVGLAADLNKSAVTLFDRLLIQPLAGLEPPRESPLLVVVDGLDEASRDGRNELAEIIGRDVGCWPDWLRLLATSRPDPEVALPFQGIAPMTLEPDSKGNLADAALFIERRFGDGGHAPAAGMREALLQRSEGNFLYLEMLWRDWKEGRAALDGPGGLPQGLGGYLLRYFERRFPDRAVYKRSLRPFLEMLAAAREPLPLLLVRDELGWGPYDLQIGPDGEAGGEIADRLGSLFPVRAGSVRPYHHSVTTWLANPRAAGPYFADAGQGRNRLAEACWAHWKREGAALSAYARAHLPAHLREAGRWDELLTLVATPEFDLHRRWTEGGEAAEGKAALSGLIERLEKQPGRGAEAADLAVRLALVHSLLGEYGEARRRIDFALDRSVLAGDDRVTAVARHELGSLQLYRREFDAATDSYRAALRLCLDHDPPFEDEAAANLSGLATISLARYDFRAAEEQGLEAGTRAGRAGDIRHVLAADRLVAAALRHTGRWEEAEARIRYAVLLAGALGFRLEKARLLMQKGCLAYERALLARAGLGPAGAVFEEALREAQAVNDMYILVESRLSLGWLALQSGPEAEAESLLRTARAVAPKDAHPELEAGLDMVRAGLLHAAGHRDAAEAAYAAAAEFCARHDLRTWLYRARIGLGALQRLNGANTEAEREWEAAIETARSISATKETLARTAVGLIRDNPSRPPL